MDFQTTTYESSGSSSPVMVFVVFKLVSSSYFSRSPDEHDSRAAAGMEVGEGN